MGRGEERVGKKDHSENIIVVEFLRTNRNLSKIRLLGEGEMRLRGRGRRFKSPMKNDHTSLRTRMKCSDQNFR